MTILIPAYNAQWFIGYAIASVLNQTRDDWNIQILVDAKTTDNTYQKAKQVRSKTKRYRQIHINVSQEPGLPNVYKELIDRAEPKDDICGFLDADDRLLPKAVEVLLRNYDAAPDLGHVWSQFQLQPSGGKGWSRPIPKSMTQIEAFSRGWWGSQHWRTFRKSVYVHSPYELQLDMPFATDYNLALVLAATDCPHRYLKEVLYLYYRNKKGITYSNQKKQRQCFIEMHRRFQRWRSKGGKCVSSSRKSTG